MRKKCANKVGTIYIYKALAQHLFTLQHSSVNKIQGWMGEVYQFIAETNKSYITDWVCMITVLYHSNIFVYFFEHNNIVDLK